MTERQPGNIEFNYILLDTPEKNPYCLHMIRWKKYVQRYQLASWLLVIALVMQLLFQLHFHLHHINIPESQQHDHMVDLHVLSDVHDADHATHENTHELKSMLGAIIKKNLDSSMAVIMAVCLLIISLATLTVIDRRWSFFRNTVLHNLYYGLAPPLRAPPAV